ncbi:MAG: hypothetical protein F6K47_29900 [Symploca sp. SIO2E6]|nr:hypothetical protein [Symploca sp. SIO2E6]
MYQDFILKQKEEYLKKLTLQYEAAYKQLPKDLNDVNKVSIKEQIKDLENEMQEVFHEIDQLRSNPEKGRELAVNAEQKEQVAIQVEQDNQAPSVIQHQQKVAEMAQEEKLKFGSTLYRKYYQNWKNNLHKINFYQATQIVHSILGQWKNKSGYSLFLINESRTLGGEWCLRIIQSFLEK